MGCARKNYCRAAKQGLKTVKERIMMDDLKQSISCDVKNCAYNENGRTCAAKHVTVENTKATTQSETYCSTFCKKNSCDCQ